MSDPGLLQGLLRAVWVVGGGSSGVRPSEGGFGWLSVSCSPQPCGGRPSVLSLCEGPAGALLVSWDVCVPAGAPCAGPSPAGSHRENWASLCVDRALVSTGSFIRQELPSAQWVCRAWLWLLRAWGLHAGGEQARDHSGHIARGRRPVSTAQVGRGREVRAQTWVVRRHQTCGSRAEERLWPGRRDRTALLQTGLCGRGSRKRKREGGSGSGSGE